MYNVRIEKMVTKGERINHGTSGCQCVEYCGFLYFFGLFGVYCYNTDSREFLKMGNFAKFKRRNHFSFLVDNSVVISYGGLREKNENEKFLKSSQDMIFSDVIQTDLKRNKMSTMELNHNDKIINLGHLNKEIRELTSGMIGEIVSLKLYQPISRYSAGGCIMKKKGINHLIIFGGGNVLGSLNINDKNFYDLDLKSKIWNGFKPSGDPISFRYGHRMTTFGNGMKCLISFGLGSDHYPRNDTIIYDFDKNECREICKNCTIKPSPRAVHGAVLIEPYKILIFGGLAKLNDNGFKDIWILDCRSELWTKVNAAFPPLYNFSYVMVNKDKCLNNVRKSCQIYCFGGKMKWNEISLKLYKLSLDRCTVFDSYEKVKNNFNDIIMKCFWEN